MKFDSNKGNISGIRLQNYKAFRDTGWIDFNKFTLLYGYNSNGKSTILRFLYQLKLCLGEYRIGRNISLWEINSQEGGFLDLLYNSNKSKASEMAFSFRLSLDEEDQSYLDHVFEEFFYETYDVESGMPEIIFTISYKYNSEKKKIDLRQVRIQYRSYCIYNYTTTHSGRYRIDTDLKQFSWNSKSPLPVLWDVRNTFVLEDKIENIYKNTLSQSEIDDRVRGHQRFFMQTLGNIKSMINQILLSYTEDFEYFYPTRNLPKRMIQLNQEDAKRVGVYGENAYNVLYAIEIKKDNEKKSAINKYLEMFGYHYEWRLQSNGYGEFLLKDLRTNAKVNILDCGFGISQILPIIVSCFDDSREALAIDSPDAHLHSAIHGQICDLLIQTSRKRNIIVETHSENMLLRLQRRIVEKNDVYPELATVYFITDEGEETVCKKLSFNEFGDLVNEPDEFKNFFSAAFEDIMSISKEKGKRMMNKRADRN